MKRLLAWLSIAFSARDSEGTDSAPRALRYPLTQNMPYQNTGFGNALIGLNHRLRQYFFEEAKGKGKLEVLGVFIFPIPALLLSP